MTTSTIRTSAPPTAPPRSWLVRAGTALMVSVVANVVLAQALAAAVDADPDFIGLQAVPVATASAVGVLLGVVAFAVLRRLDRQRVFVPLIAAGALLSLGGPLGLLGSTPAEQPGVTDAAALALVPLHLLVAVVVAVVLSGRPR